MIVHSLIDARPPARDGIPWNRARIEQSATEDGVYATNSTVTLDPLDSDPEDPAFRDFTFNSAFSAAWFRIVWLDDDDHESQPTEPVYDDGSGVAWRPTVRDVGAILRARATDGTFTADTRPTEAEVIELIDKAVDEVGGRIGGFEVISDSNRAFARELATLRAAMGVELGYYPEQTNTDRSAYENLRQLYEDGMEGFLKGIPDSASTRHGIYSVPMTGDFGNLVSVGELLP